LNILFLDLRRQTRVCRADLQEAIERVLEGGRYVFGKEVDDFEREFAAFCGAEFAVGVASGTDAIAVALQAVGVAPGEEVVTAANTCVPTIAGIEGAGAVPVLADVDHDTFTLDPAGLEEALTERTKAVVPVHLYGQCADLNPVLEVARAHDLKVVEDCAQAHGAEYAGRRAGCFGDAAAFSFYPTKNLGAIGDGGAVVTTDPGVAERARLLRNYGERERFEHVLRGRNSRLDALQAAVLGAKLPFLEPWNERRREIAGRYTDVLAGSDVLAPVEDTGRHHVYHLYVVRAPDRERFRSELAQRGIETAVHYPIPVHRQPAYRELDPVGRSLSVSERLASSIVSVPLYPELTDDEVEYVAQSLGAVASLLSTHITAP
jgi:dTDP-4-amino-4,6-dideoxygalactose transaminase